MFCSKCGYKHDGKLKFCPKCGNKLFEDNAEVVTSTQPVINNQPVSTVVSTSNMPTNQQQSIVQPNYNLSGNNKKEKSKSTLIIILTVIIAVVAILCVYLYLTKSDKETLERDYKKDTRTVMIYMVGSDLESENAIASSDINSINPAEVDLENVNVLLYTGGTEKWHNFVSSDENAIYQLTDNGFEKVKTYGKENMGSAETFSTFLDYAYENYATEHYDLIIYNHGGAIDGAVYDDFTGDKLSLLDFKSALSASPFNEDNKLELVLFRTCLNGTIEVADVFDEYADYLIASSEVTLGSPFTPVLGFLNDIETTDDAIEFGEKYIEEYKQQMDRLDPYSEIGQMYAIVDLSETEEVVELLEEFVNGINLDDNYASVVRVRSNMFQFAYTYFDESSYDMVDLYELVEGLSPYSKVSSQELLNAIEDAVIYKWSNINDSHGLSIYFPYNGNGAVQSYFLNLYNGFDFNDSYYKFINEFASLSSSNKASSFNMEVLVDSETNVTNNEFELQLTEEQKAEFAKAHYIVFHKEDDGYYTPILSSDDTILDENGVLKTNMSNNLIKIVTAEDEEYIQLIERNINGNKTYYSGSVILSYFDANEDISKWHSESATVYFKPQDDKVVVTNIILTGDEQIEGTVADLDNYKTIQFWNFRYQILDKDGNYTSDWEGSPTQYGIEVSVDEEYEFKRASLDEGDYYCIFVIRDIYGNVSYSKLISIN